MSAAFHPLFGLEAVFQFNLVGAFLVGFFLTPYFHVRTIEAPFNLPTLGVTLLGTVVLVVLFNLSRKNRLNL